MFQIITHLIIYLLVYKLSKQNTFLRVNIRKNMSLIGVVYPVVIIH